MIDTFSGFLKNIKSYKFEFEIYTPYPNPHRYAEDRYVYNVKSEYIHWFMLLHGVDKFLNYIEAEGVENIQTEEYFYGSSKTYMLDHWSIDSYNSKRLDECLEYQKHVLQNLLQNRPETDISLRKSRMIVKSGDNFKDYWGFNTIDDMSRYLKTEYNYKDTVYFIWFNLHIEIPSFDKTGDGSDIESFLEKMPTPAWDRYAFEDAILNFYQQ